MTKKDAKTKRAKKNSYYKVSHAHEPRSKSIKRFSLYAFFTILTIALSVLIFYRSKGYTFTKSGEVEKRGIVLIDSAPVSAKVFIDGKDTGKKTDYKLEISEGSHTLRLEAKGYKTWEKSFNIKSEQVEWFYYPYLIPNTLVTQDLQNNLPQKVYSGLNSDSKVLAASKTGLGASQSLSFEILNLKEDEPAKMTSPILVPTQIFSRQTDGALGTVSFMNWSPNGEYIYVEHTFDGKKELINLNVNSPAKSTNLTNSIGADIAQYRYDDRSRLYLLRSGELAIYNPETLAKDQIIDNAVLNFNNFKEDKYIYAKASILADRPGTEVIIKSGQETAKTITVISAGTALDLDFQYTTNRRENYLTISNLANKELIIYKNPLESDKTIQEPLFLSTFASMQSNQIKESVQGSAQPGSYIALQLSPTSIFVFNFEDESSLSYSPGSLQISDISWIDSEHLQAKTADGKIYYLDYDGNYPNEISSTNQPFSYFVKNKNKTIVVNSSDAVREKISEIKFKE